jgi:hypothetical protein
LLTEAVIGCKRDPVPPASMIPFVEALYRFVIPIGYSLLSDVSRISEPRSQTEPRLSI